MLPWKAGRSQVNLLVDEIASNTFTIEYRLNVF